MSQYRLSVKSLYPGAAEPRVCEGDEAALVSWVYKHFPQVQHAHFQSLPDLLEYMNEALHGHASYLEELPQLQKAWPRDEKDNLDQQQGFFGSDSWKVHEDELLQDGWGIKSKWNKQPRPSDKSVWGKRYTGTGHRPGFEPDGAPEEVAGRVGDVINDNGGYGISDREPTNYGWGLSEKQGYTQGYEEATSDLEDHQYWQQVGDESGIPRPFPNVNPAAGPRSRRLFTDPTSRRLHEGGPIERVKVAERALASRKQREKDPAFRDRNVKPMKKVSLNPDESASRMKMDSPFFPEVYDRIHSYRTPEGFYHHVYDKQLGPEFLHQLHVISLHPSPLMHTGMMASATTNRKSPPTEFLNNPWGGQDFVHMSTVVSKYPHRGWGSLLYRAMTRHGRRMISDSLMSAPATSAWKKLITDPEFRGEMGHMDDHGLTRHWAEHKGEAPSPYLEFSPKNRALTQKEHQDFPWEARNSAALQKEYMHLNAAQAHDFRQHFATNTGRYLGPDWRPESSHAAPMEDLGILPEGLQEAGNLQKSDDGPSSPQELVQDMLGFRPWDSASFRAARTLVGGREATLKDIRNAIWGFTGDEHAQALNAFGIPVTDKSRKLLQQIIRLQAGKPLRKTESQIPRNLDHVRALDDDGQELQQTLRDAIDGRKVEVVDLGGKHSQGTLLIDTKDQGQWLLKPGHGVSPAAGAEQDPSSQSQRESAFWHVARRWGIGDDIPRTELMAVDGKQYAAIQMLSPEWKNLGRLDVKKGNHPRVVKALERYRPGGQLHRWAVLDFVAGNPDRHAQNLMLGPEEQVKLIDHGTTFAGEGFDPAGDQKSFIPFYLRYQAPPDVWSGSTPVQKQKWMPVIPSQEVREGLSQWILALDPVVVKHQLQHFGINPEPSLERLRHVQELVKAHVHQPDRVLNQLWARA